MLSNMDGRAKTAEGMPFAGGGSRSVDFMVETSPGFGTGATVSVLAARELAKKLAAQAQEIVEPLYVRLRETAEASEVYLDVHGLLADVSVYISDAGSVTSFPAVEAAVSAIQKTFGEVTEEVLEEISKDLREVEEGQHFVQRWNAEKKCWSFISRPYTALEAAEERERAEVAKNPESKHSLVKVTHKLNVIR